MTTTGNIKKAVSLREKIAWSKFNSFGAKTEEEYREKIRHMNHIDLCSHAIKYNLDANSDRKRVERSLVNEFRRAKAQVEAELQQITTAKSTPKTENAEKILSFIKN